MNEDHRANFGVVDFTEGIGRCVAWYRDRSAAKSHAEKLAKEKPQAFANFGVVKLVGQVRYVAIPYEWHYFNGEKP